MLQLNYDSALSKVQRISSEKKKLRAINTNMGNFVIYVDLSRTTEHLFTNVFPDSMIAFTFIIQTGMRFTSTENSHYLLIANDYQHIKVLACNTF